VKKNLFILFTIIAFSVILPQKKAFTIEDLYKIKNVGGPSLSPDGSKIAFTVSTSDLKTTKSKTNIYLINSDGSGLKQIPLSGVTIAKVSILIQTEAEQIRFTICH